MTSPEANNSYNDPSHTPYGQPFYPGNAYPQSFPTDPNYAGGMGGYPGYPPGSTPNTGSATPPSYPVGYNPQLGYNPQFFPQYSPYPSAPPRRSGNKLILGAIALAVLLAVGAGVFFVVHKDSPSQSAQGSSQSTSHTTDLSSPQSVVSDYFAALQHGDAQKALSLGNDKPEDTTFLTREVLTQQYAQHPLEHLTITGDSPSQVHVSFSIDGKQYDEDVQLTRTDNNSYKLARSYVTLRISSEIHGLQFFGKEIASPDAINVFPGPVNFAPSNNYVKFTPKNVDKYNFSAFAAGQTSAVSYPFTVAVTSHTKKVIDRLIRNKIRSCGVSLDTSEGMCPLAFRQATSRITHVSFSDDGKYQHVKPGIVNFIMPYSYSYNAIGREYTMHSRAMGQIDLMKHTIQISFSN